MLDAVGLFLFRVVGIFAAFLLFPVSFFYSVVMGVWITFFMAAFLIIGAIYLFYAVQFVFFG